MNLPDILANFMFIRPLWLFALPGLIAVYWLLNRVHSTNPWRRFIEPDKLAHLVMHSPASRSMNRMMLPLAWIITVLALSGPSWESSPQPVSQNRDALIVLFDLSPSMRNTDIRPDRVTRARIKLIDLLRQRRDGETALIAYAADAHRVSPLTDDTANIEALAPTLHPDIMPVQGSNVSAAARLALDMFAGANLDRGEIVVFTDGIEDDERLELGQLIPPDFTLSILGIGTRAGSPVTSREGGFMRDQQGKLIVRGLDASVLRDTAQQHGGRYATLGNDDQDLATLLAATSAAPENNTRDTRRTFDGRVDGGIWLLLLLVPLGLLAFRRGVIFSLALCFALPLTVSPQPAYAFDWMSLLKRPDQRGADALNADDPERAAALFENRDWRGVARYRAGDFAGAAHDFAANDSAMSKYNLANALALQGDLEGAIDMYDRLIEADSDFENAKHNRDVIAKLLEQQKQEQQQAARQEQDEEEKQPSASQSSGGEQQDDPEKQMSEQPTGEEEPEDPGEQMQASGQQEKNPEEENEDLSDLSEQWLRNIAQDPGGFMRRKFRHEAKARSDRGEYNNSAEARRRF